MSKQQEQVKTPWEKTLEEVLNEEPGTEDQLGLTARAADWTSCAVGEALGDLGIKCVSSVIDDDRDLNILGNTFYERITEQNYEAAQNAHAEIKKHVAHRRNALVATYRQWR